TLPAIFALVLAAVPPAHAHHAMDYQMPATLLEGLLSGLGHPIIGIDHLLFIIGAGVVAAHVARGPLLALLFVAGSLLAAAARAGGLTWDMSELWIAGSLIALGALALAMPRPGLSLVAMLYAAAGMLHGYALAAAIVGAEPTPLYAYFLGLAVIQSVIALGAWAGARWLRARHPALPVQRIAGAALGVAGIFFAGAIVLG
ncbi:MAG TPA: HupE/UreJ family protein, partial [Longimicrobiales bacterium]